MTSKEFKNSFQGEEAKEGKSTGMTRQMEKLKIQQFLLEKRREETWQRALTSLGLRPQLLQEMSREQIQATFEPFKSAYVKLIRSGFFKTSRVKKIVLEVTNVEVVGNCYQVRLQVTSTI